MTQADDAALYNKLLYSAPDVKTAYQPLFRLIVQEMLLLHSRSILEVGCGAGVLANMVCATGVTYTGFDIADKGIALARAANPERGRFFVGSATNPQSYAGDYDTIICSEVLEHIKDDRETVGLWPPEKRVICSVPNFADPTHVRLFTTDEEVRKRYGDFIKFDRINRIATPVAAGLTWREYVRRVRWARENGWRGVLGALGVNSFNWHGGWFVFVGSVRPR